MNSISDMNFKQLREVFIFTAKERNGLLILVFILFLVVGGNYFLPYFVPEKEYDTSSWKREAAKLYQPATVIIGQKESSSDDHATIAPSNSLQPTGEGSLHSGSYSGSFDPNNVKLNILLEMGVPARLAANWLKYVQKGGKFFKKEDVLKLYGMDSEVYERVKEHLIFTAKKGLIGEEWANEKIPEKDHARYRAKDTLKSNDKKNVAIVQLDVNQADSIQLEALPGIGPALASRIIKYRKLLGGFYEVNQLKEIYGMNDEWWGRISPWLMISNINLNRLEINYLSLVEMGRHPYIGFRTAKKIIKIRDTTGKFRTTEELASIFSADSLKRILPYLVIGVAND